jgi:hypothetical protein
VVGYQWFEGPSCLCLQGEDFPKCWYPTPRYHNPEDLDLNFIAVKTSKLAQKFIILFFLLHFMTISKLTRGPILYCNDEVTELSNGARNLYVEHKYRK